MKFIDKRLSIQEYESTVLEIFFHYGLNLAFYELVDTMKYGRWNISAEDIALLITHEDYLNIKQNPTMMQKHFFYDSDYYVFYSYSHESKKWELGLGKDYDRQPFFKLMEE